jgi:ABC-type antimicrobial peptide transport system permease subunit
MGTLHSQKGRTTLIVLAQSIGIALLALTTAFTGGVQRRVQDVLAAFWQVDEGRIFFVGLPRLAAENEVPPRARMVDLAALRDRFGSEITFAGLIEADEVASTSTATREVRVCMVQPEFVGIRGWKVVSGEPLSDEDERSKGRVCVITESFAREFFGDQAPIGRELILGDAPFLVKGVRRDEASIERVSKKMAEAVLVPLQTGMRRISAQEGPSVICFRVRGSNAPAEAAAAIRAFLSDRHSALADGTSRFGVNMGYEMETRLRGAHATLVRMAWLLTSAALLLGATLGSGAILLTVGHRLPEIGLKRSLGATRRDVAVEFLTETMLISTLALIVGLAISASVAYALQLVSTNASIRARYPLILSLQTVGVPIGVALLLGFACGLLPAIRAARIEPARVLR